MLLECDFIICFCNYNNYVLNKSIDNILLFYIFCFIYMVKYFLIGRLKNSFFISYWNKEKLKIKIFLFLMFIIDLWVKMDVF